MRHARGRHPHRRVTSTRSSTGAPGLLADDRDELAAALDRVLSDAALRARLGDRRAASTRPASPGRRRHAARSRCSPPSAMLRRTPPVTSTLTERSPRRASRTGSRALPRGRLRCPRVHRARAARVHPAAADARRARSRRHEEYLYLDPGRLLERAPSMWDPNIGLGTVTHQNIGYLFPMGPYYWLLDALGVPDWVAQRLWLGSILLFAALGMLYLFRTLALRGPGVVVGALAYMLSPYSLDYAARISVILLPWAALPWLLAFVIRALRDGGWQVPGAVRARRAGGRQRERDRARLRGHRARCSGSRTRVARHARGRRGGASSRPCAKIGGAHARSRRCGGSSGCRAQGSYGLDILKLHRDAQDRRRRPSLPNEVLRGLGYWFFYGRDKLGPWIEPSVRVHAGHPCSSW